MVKSNMKYPLKYTETLIDSSFANHQTLQYVMDPNFRGQGITGVDVPREMPYVYDIVEDEVEEGNLPDSALELIEESNVILSFFTIGELWLSITKMQKGKGGNISFSTGEKLTIKIAEDLSVSISYRR